MKKALNISLYIISFVAFSITAAFISTLFKDYGYDRLAYSINNYNTTNMFDKNYHDSIVNIISNDRNDKSAYNDPFDYFYHNALNNNTRQQVTQKTSFHDYSISLQAQPTFTIYKSDKASVGYYVDYGLYNAYYLNEVFPNKGYLDIRENCDSFIFISDTFADKLVDYYQIKTENPYKTLIENKDYYILCLDVDGKDTIKLCINNIIYSTIGDGIRTSELYGDFGIFYYNNLASQHTQLEFEIDLKDSPYSIKKTIRDLERFGYSSSSHVFSFKKYNHISNNYEYYDCLSKQYVDIQSKKDLSLLAISLFFIDAILSLLSLLIFRKFIKTSLSEKRIIFAACFILFFVFGIIVTFVYNYYLFSIVPIIQIIMISLMLKEEVFGGVIRFFKRESILDSSKKNNFLCEIEI